MSIIAFGAWYYLLVKWRLIFQDIYLHIMFNSSIKKWPYLIVKLYTMFQKLDTLIGH